MKTATQTPTDIFSDYVDREIDVAKQRPEYDKWRTYEYLKRQIENFNIEYREGIEMIIDKLEI